MNMPWIPRRTSMSSAGFQVRSGECRCGTTRIRTASGYGLHAAPRLPGVNGSVSIGESVHIPAEKTSGVPVLPGTPSMKIGLLEPVKTGWRHAALSIAGFALLPRPYRNST
jgi:hypothetical protein